MPTSTPSVETTSAETPPVGTPAPTRPRVEGEREQEILAAALGVLAEVGYDRLTMDAVAQAAHASKATLYRRWSSKAALVVEALQCQESPQEVPDTGTLRGDLLALFCDRGGPADDAAVAVFTGVLTALARDPEFAVAFRRDFLAPKSALLRAVLERARDRGEVAADADLDLLMHVVPALVVHQLVLTGDHPGPDLVSRVVDRIVLPAASCRGGCHLSPQEDRP